MNILMVCPYFYPDTGGVENYVYYIAKALVKKGHKITVLCSTKEKKDKTEIIDGIKVIRQKPDFVISNTVIKIKLYFTISKLLKNEKFDIVNAHTPVPYYADMACYASKKHKVPFILTYHSSRLKKDKFLFDLLISAYQSIFEKYMFINSKKIIPVSDTPLKTFLKKYSDKCVIITPSVNSSYFKPNDSHTSENSILFVGQISSFHRWKGLDYLLEAMTYIPKKIKLTVIGHGDLLDYYKGIAKKMKINVEFKGKVSQEELIKGYQKTKCVVLPSISDMEGMPTVIFEAMACGKPVIGTKVGGIPYVVKNEKNGLLVEPKNPKELADAINKLLNDKKLLEKLSKNALYTIKNKHELKIIVDKTEKVLKNNK